MRNRKTRQSPLFRRDANMLFGLLVLGLLLLGALAGWLDLLGDPDKLDATSKYLPPSLKHLFGTDNFGRDVLSRVLSGASHTFAVAIGIIGISGTAGLFLGSVAGYVGKWLDAVITRLADAVFSFPGVLLAMVFVAVFGPGTRNTILSLGIVFTPGFARVLRGGMIQQKSLKYVELARVCGVSSLRIMLVHILPNLAPTILSAFTIGFANAILAESGLSYLGLSVQPPAASWGTMLADGQSYLFRAPWMVIFPGLAIVLAVMGFHSLGEAIRNRNNREGRL